MSLFSKIELPGGDKYGVRAGAIPFGRVDSTSTATAFTATVLGVTELTDGTCVMLDNGVITSASGFTLNVNGLGAKPVYTNLAAATRDTTIFNIAYTMLFVYDEERVSGGCWVCYRGYDANTNTIGYQLRTNSTTLTASDKGYRYRLWFTSADGTKRVPANISTATDSTTARTLNTRPINPFGSIIYYSTNGTTNAGAKLSATTQWEQYTLTIGYTYVITLADNKPVYVQCTPQSDGSAVMNTITQTLPSTEDGKIYIFLGFAYTTTSIELRPNHPIYYYKDGAIRLWTNTAVPEVVDTYSSTGTDAISGKGVAEALGTLDSSISATTGQAISAITITDGKITNSSKVSVGDANQNAFSNIKIGSSTITADTTTDTVELVASGLVSLTADTTNDKVTIGASYTETDPTVPSWAKEASKPTYTASEVGAVPTSRKVNGKALSANISLSASDVGALPDSTVIPQGTVTSVATGTGLTGGTITASGTISLDGTYGLTTSDIITGTDTTNKLISAKTLADTLGGLGGGTITGVTAGTGLSGGGTSGGVTLNHSNSVTAQNTQAVYPIKIDAQGHISGYGSAVTIPTVPSAGTSASAVGTSSSGGSATTWSKSDHVHSISGTTITSALGYTPYDSTNPNNYITANDVPKENFIVTVTLTSLTGGTSDKTSDEIAAAAAAGKLPVVVTQYYNALLVAPLSWIKISSDPLESSIAYFTYEDQFNDDIPYAMMQIWNSAVTLSFKNAYITPSAIPTAGTTATAVSTSASGGSATTWSKSDHVHSISSSTITSALGYTPYNSTNPSGYITSSAITAHIVEVVPPAFQGDFWTINDTFANILAMLSDDKKVVFRTTVDANKYNYWCYWFTNSSNTKIGLYRYEKDDESIQSIVFTENNGTLYGTPRVSYLTSYSPEDTVYETSVTNVSVNNGTWKSIASLTLPAGTYIMQGNPRFGSVTNKGSRQVCISTSQNSNDTHGKIVYDFQATSGSSNVIGMQTSYIITLTSETTVYLNVFHTQGASLTVSAEFQAGRIR